MLGHKPPTGALPAAASDAANAAAMVSDARAQGKTTTMSKFLATLLLMSPVGGNLVFLYSTSLDRAQEVLRAAKVIVDWVLSDTPTWAPRFSKVRDNERMVSIFNGRAVNTAVARPKRVESCRGDAAHCVMVDEVAFVEQAWWDRFLVPTFNNANRRTAQPTTPPAHAISPSPQVHTHHNAPAKGRLLPGIYPFHSTGQRPLWVRQPQPRVRSVRIRRHPRKMRPRPPGKARPSG